MQLVIESEPAPIAADAHGAYRVGGTRVTLDTVIAAFHDGATPEEIVEQYPAIGLDHAYAVIGYYLRHQPVRPCFRFSQTRISTMTSSGA